MMENSQNKTSKKIPRVIIERRYSDPILTTSEFPELLNSRRNGKHDIYSGVCGDQVLSLFLKFNQDENKLNVNTVIRSNSYCGVITELGKKSEEEVEIICDFLPIGYSDRSLSSSDTALAPEDNNNKKSTKPPLGSTSPRLCKRRNGMCYVNSTDMILKTMKHKKAVEAHQKRSNNVMLQLSCN